MPLRPRRSCRCLPARGRRALAAGRLPRLLGVLAGACLLSGPAARASSPEAWARYDRQVRAACVAASGLAAVRVRGSRIDLPSLGLSSLLLEGRFPQPHMGGRQGLELCVFEQRSGRAGVAEADSLRPALSAEAAAPGTAKPAAAGSSPASPTGPSRAGAGPMAPR